MVGRCHLAGKVLRLPGNLVVECGLCWTTIFCQQSATTPCRKSSAVPYGHVFPGSALESFSRTRRKICQAPVSLWGYVVSMFEPEYRERINKVMKMIIRNPGGTWTTSALAGLAGMSAFHFHRIFRALTGETMFAFLQRRRLLRAIELMHEGQYTLTEIALDCGFDSGSSLSRAFMKHFHCSPSHYRQHHPPLPLPPPRPRVNGKTAVPGAAIREVPTCTAVIVERQGMLEQHFNQAAAAAFGVLTSAITRVNGWHAIRARIGLCPDEAGMVPDAEARYQAGFVYEGALPALGEDVRRVTIPGGTWAVFRHYGSYETLWQSWNLLYRDWLPSSGYGLRDTVPFEVYLNDKKHVPTAALQIAREVSTDLTTITGRRPKAWVSLVQRVVSL